MDIQSEGKTSTWPFKSYVIWDTVCSKESLTYFMSSFKYSFFPLCVLITLSFIYKSSISPASPVTACC